MVHYCECGSMRHAGPASSHVPVDGPYLSWRMFPLLRSLVMEKNPISSTRMSLMSCVTIKVLDLEV